MTIYYIPARPGCVIEKFVVLFVCLFLFSQSQITLKSLTDLSLLKNKQKILKP